MNRNQFQVLCNQISDEVERLLPEFLQNPDDFKIAKGNCALAILNAQGESCGRMFGDFPPRQRECAQIAWKKANQVWLTSYSTGQLKPWFTQNKLMKPGLVWHVRNILAGLAE